MSAFLHDTNTRQPHTAQCTALPRLKPGFPTLPRTRRYQSTISGSFQVVEIIETFVSYMESLERCVW